MHKLEGRAEPTLSKLTELDANILHSVRHVMVSRETSTIWRPVSSLRDIYVEAKELISIF